MALNCVRSANSRTNILVTLYFLILTINSLLTTIIYDFFLNKLLICCLLIARMAVVKFRDVEYGHAEYVVFKY